MALPGRDNARPGNNTKLPGADRRPGNNTKLPGADRRPGNDIKRPGLDNKRKVSPGRNTKDLRKPDFNNRKIDNSRKNNNWWNGGNNNKINIGSGNTNININNNFKTNVNWSTNQKNWGYNPWWNRSSTRKWYGGTWNCGWNKKYYHRHYPYGRAYRPPGYVVIDDGPSTAEMIGWGLLGWGLGKMIFDSGYQSYKNPYPTQPVPTTLGNDVTYSQPITVVASQTAPSDDESIEAATEGSESFIEKSQEAFKSGDFLAALDFANKAVAEAPGDGALHEYRALVLFALGKFGEAAGVLNPVLASGPGWDWTTMVKIYDTQDTYTKQLQALEAYVDGKPDAADGHFLLGYHYMVCGHLDLAEEQFGIAAKLQPADSVSAQMADLCASSSASGEDDESDDGDDGAPSAPPEAVPLEQLAGTWISDKGADGKISLVLKDDGTFSWTYTQDGKDNGFSGEFSMNDDGLLLLDAEESQMAASVTLTGDNKMKFILAGGPPSDPGLDFTKS